MTRPVKCLAVDDHPTDRQGLALLFGASPDLELIGTVEDGEEALESIKRLKPEVVVMDVRLPGIDGISAVKRIQQGAPSVQTVVFSAYGDKRLLSDAIAAGARGYVMKGSPPEDLLRAIRTVKEGKAFVDPSDDPGRGRGSAVGARAGDPAAARRGLPHRAGRAADRAQRRDREVRHDAGDHEARGRHPRARRGDRP